MVKVIRRLVILSSTWKTHVWKCLRACVYIYRASCNVFRGSRRKGRIYTFLFFWIHVITGWKMFKYFNNPVERINRLQVNWSLITLDTCTIWCWIWNNLISWIPLTSMPKSVIHMIWNRMYNLHRIYSRPNKNIVILWKIMNRMQKSKIWPSSTQNIGAH